MYRKLARDAAIAGTVAKLSGRGANAVYNAVKSRIFNRSQNVARSNPNRRRNRPKRGVNNGNASRTLTRGGPNPRNRISAPVAGSSMVRRLPSRIDNMVFNHTELLYVVAGTTDYGVVAFNINPGLQVVFPWLGQVAPLWDMYNVESMSFRYVPTCSTATNGSVFLGFDYDVYDEAPVDKNAFMMLQEACSGPAWSDCDITLKRQSLMRRRNLYVRTGGLQGDQKTYDLGRLFVGTIGQASAGTFIGEIYVNYTIRLSIPQQLQVPLSDYFNAQNVSGQTPAIPFGSAVNPNLNSNVVGPTIISSAGTSQWICQRTGTYTIILMIAGTGISPNFATDITPSFPTDYPDDHVDEILTTVISTNTACYVGTLKISDGNGLNFSIGTATTISRARFICEPSNLYNIT